MKILLFGSIASGKTTIARKILTIHKNFDFIAIDDYRREFGDYTKDGENAARENFIKSILPEKDQIIEASGLGKLGRDIHIIVSEFNEDVLIIILRIPITIINRRIADKNWDTPFPGKQDKLETIIQSINFGIEFGEIPMLWSENPKHTIFQIENIDHNTETFIIDLINNYIKLKEFVKKNCHRFTD